MILLFLGSEDRATVRTDLSAGTGFTKESDAWSVTLFYMRTWDNTTLLWKTQCATVEQLREMRFSGMANEFNVQLKDPAIDRT